VYAKPGLSPVRRRGFTLIEVLVVIAIIALLVSILLPTLARVRAHGRAAVCRSNERQIGEAMTAFSSEHGGWIPRGLSRHPSAGDLEDPPSWVRMIARIFGDKKSYSANFNRVPVEKWGGFTCPERSTEYPGKFLDYVINSMDHRGPIRLSDCASSPRDGTWFEVEGVTKKHVWSRPSEVIYVADAVEESWGVNDPNNNWGTLKGIRENIETVRAPVPPRQTGFDWFDVPGARGLPTYYAFFEESKQSGDPRLPRAALKMHLDRGSYGVFVDGHVEMVMPPEQDAGPQRVQQFYLRRFGVDPDVIPECTALDTTAALHPCVAGNTTWRP